MPDGQEEFKVFVGGLSWKIDEKELKEAFGKFDAVDATVMLDKMTSRPRGFGFVYFPNDKLRSDAIAEMHGKEIDGRKISVVKAVPQNETKPGTPASVLGGDRYGGGRRDYAGGREGGYGGGYGARDRGYGGGYDSRGGGGYDRGYPAAGGAYAGAGGGYADPRYGGGGGGYDRGYAGGYGGEYGREPARDPYARDPYARPPPYADPYAGGYGDPYARGGYPAPAYDDRGAAGGDRGRGYAPPGRATPYDRVPPRDSGRPLR